MDYLHKENHINHIVSIPFIWSLAIPFVFLDICVELYHRTCFPLYGLPIVDRSKYIVFDRYKLNYLDVVQKSNCTYCAYINGLLKYITEIGAQTEQYWCAIKHANEKAVYPEHHETFAEYGDITTLNQKYNNQLTNFKK